MLPGYLKPLIEDPISEVASDVPDSTSSPVKSPQTCPSPPPSLPFTTAPQRSPEPDLHCEEDLSNDCQLTEEFSNDECCLSPGDERHRDSRTSSPLSAVDIFNEFEIDDDGFLDGKAMCSLFVAGGEFEVGLILFELVYSRLLS